MKAGLLRHRITIQRKSETVDPATGYPTLAWVDYMTSVPAQYFPGPGREYLAGEALRAEVTGRFVIRYTATAAAVRAGDRVIWDGRTMELKAPPMPDEIGRVSYTLMVAEDGSDGA